MTKKEIVINAIQEVKGNEVDGVYEVTTTQLNQLDAELGNTGLGFTFCNSKKDESLKAIYDASKKTKYAVIRIVAEKVKKTRTTKNKTEVQAEGISYKAKHDNYTIVIKEIDQEEKTITDIDTCAAIKEFMKTIKKKNLEYLHIFKMGNVPTRMSAWVEK